MWNDDVEISLCRPKEQMDYFFRNGEGDEVVFVHEGTGTLETIFGQRPVQGRRLHRHPARHDVPLQARGRAAAISSSRAPGQIEIPRRYRNQYGQMLEGAPYYHRDIHPPTS
jgi:homogentisate 1,2-dioxygenase